MGGVVFVLVRRLRRVVADEWVTLMSCCPSILEMGLEREGWNFRLNNYSSAQFSWYKTQFTV